VRINGNLNLAIKHLAEGLRWKRRLPRFARTPEWHKSAVRRNVFLHLMNNIRLKSAGMFQRFFRRYRTVEPATRISALPDPMQQFPNPGNHELFSFFISDWRSQKLPPEKMFEYSPHPELMELFDELCGAFGVRDIKKATLYGKRLAAIPDNLVFAWAQGIAEIFIRLQPSRHTEAVAAGGRLDATYPPNWVEFIAGGTRMAGYNAIAWRSVILKWMQIGYEDCLNLRNH
jgi:hypothetical protein